jgi:ATP-dependent Clp protease protease subunit
VSKTIGIAEKFLTAYEGGDAVTLKVTGIVGMDFSGMQLASAVESYATEGNVIIELDSVGGFVSDAFAFYDQVRAKGLKVSVDGYGTVASAATIIMAAAGRKRSRLSPNAEYLVHNASGGDAEGLKRANEKMADIYAELTGKDRKSILAKMKEDKPMSAEDARKWGFVGSVIELQKLAAKADKTNDMEDNVKAKHAFKLTAQQVLSAALGNEIEIEMDINAEAATQLTAYAGEVKALKTEVDELKADVEAKDAAITAAASEVTKIEADKAAAEAKVAELTAKVAECEATIASLKTTPIAPKVGPKGSVEPVVPGADNEAPTHVPETEDERSEKLRAYVASMKRTKKTA